MQPPVIPTAGLLQLGVSVLLFSSAWPITKQAITLGANPMWFAFGRAGFSGLAAFVALALLGRLRWPGRADFPALFAVGLLQLATFFAFAHFAVSLVPAGRTAVLSNVTTVWIVPLSLWLLGEAIPPRRWIAAGLGLAGIAVLINPWAIDWSQPGVVLGHVLLLGAAGAWAIAMVIVRRTPPHLSMLQLLPWCFGLASLALLPLALLTGEGPGHWGGPAIGALAYIGLLAGPVGTWCVMQVAATLPTMIASIGFLATPAAGLLLSAWWLGEKITADLVAGTVCILAGVAVATWPRRTGR